MLKTEKTIKITASYGAGGRDAVTLDMPFYSLSRFLRFCRDIFTRVGHETQRIDFTLYGREGRKCCFAVDAHDFRSTYTFRRCRKNILRALKE